MGIVRKFLRDTFVERFSAPIPIGEVPEPRIPTRDRAESARIDIAVTANRVIAGVLVLGILFLIVYPFAKPDHKIPDVIQNIVSACVGYFLSVLNNFASRRSR